MKEGGERVSNSGVNKFHLNSGASDNGLLFPLNQGITQNLMTQVETLKVKFRVLKNYLIQFPDIVCTKLEGKRRLGSGAGGGGGEGSKERRKMRVAREILR